MSATTRLALAGLKQVEAQLGPVSVIVNNAGITRDAMLHRMTPEQWRDVIRVDLDSMFNMVHPVINGMRDRNYGRIINISSSMAKRAKWASPTIRPLRQV